MKRLLKYFLMALITVVGVFSGKTSAEAFSYTYTVSFSTGAQGSFGGNSIQVRKAAGNDAEVSVSSSGDKIIVTGLEYGDVVSCDAQGSVGLSDNSKYYVKGIRLSGRDNNTVANSAFLVSGDQDYVVAYGIPGELAEYTVNYVDANGNKLADSRTYYGNVGDEPVIAYLYIDGYTPDSYNQTGKLVSDASKNVFNFVYTQATTSIADNGGANGAGGAANEAAGAGNNAAGANTAGAANAGATNAAGVNGAGAANGANTPAAGADANGNVVIPDGQNTPAAGNETPDAQPNTTIDDQDVPQAANSDNHGIADEKVPLGTLIKESGMVVPISIGAIAVAVLIVLVTLGIRNRVKVSAAKKTIGEHKQPDNKN